MSGEKISLRENAVNLLEFYGKPGQMAFWGNLDNLIDFLEVQAYFHRLGSSPAVSSISIILEETAEKLKELKMKSLSKEI